MHSTVVKASRCCRGAYAVRPDGDRIWIGARCLWVAAGPGDVTTTPGARRRQASVRAEQRSVGGDGGGRPSVPHHRPGVVQDCDEVGSHLDDVHEECEVVVLRPPRQALEEVLPGVGAAETEGGGGDLVDCASVQEELALASSLQPVVAYVSNHASKFATSK